MLKKPFFLGSLKLASNIFCAPLAGCSDFPFRRLTTSYQPGLVFCEMVKMEALVRGDFNTYQMLDYGTEMSSRIGAQLCGSKVELAGVSAKILESMGFNVIDLNCGCPVDKVTNDGSGSGLLKNPQKIGDIISKMVSTVKIPITVKIRLGWDQDSIVAPEIVEIAEKAGAQAITVHGRTRAQGYKGSANWEWIKICKQRAKHISVIGNGDLMSAKDVENIFQLTGCDGVLLARGTLGSPWIIKDIYDHFEGNIPIIRTGVDYKDILLKHLNFIEEYYPPRKAVTELRRIGCWYLKKGKNIKQLREKINQSNTVEEIRELIFLYPWETIDENS